MITAVIGLTGSGKTWWLTELLYSRWQLGARIVSYHDLYFSEDQERCEKFWQLSDLYTQSDCVIGFPELQKLLNSRNWASLPPMFLDLICQQRHSQIDIIGDTQDLMQIDVSLRRNIHDLYVCRSILRWPRDERILPLIHWISIQHKRRELGDSDSIKFVKTESPQWHFISRLWTKKKYDTYEKSRLSRYVTWTKRQGKKWITTIANRSLLTSGKVRR